MVKSKSKFIIVSDSEEQEKSLKETSSSKKRKNPSNSNSNEESLSENNSEVENSKPKKRRSEISKSESEKNESESSVTNSDEEYESHSESESTEESSEESQTGMESSEEEEDEESLTRKSSRIRKIEKAKAKKPEPIQQKITTYRKRNPPKKKVDLEGGNKDYTSSNKKPYPKCCDPCFVFVGLPAHIQVSESEEESEESDESEDNEEEVSVDRILAKRTTEEQKIEYLVKLKKYSYLHLEWLSRKKVAKSNRKWLSEIENKIPIFEAGDSEFDYCDDDCITIDRILDEDDEDDLQYLVKWRGFGYEDCTWELEEDLKTKSKNFSESFQRFNEINSKEQMEKTKIVPKLHPPSDHKKLEPPPFKNDNHLKDYQVEGFRWLAHSYYQNRNVILADEMGLGKTIQGISILQHLYVREKISGPFLVVAPKSTMTQWIREIEGWTDMNAVLFQGDRDARNLIYKHEWFFPETNKSSGIYKFNVLVTSYPMTMMESKKLGSIPWQYVIIDEGQKLKNPDSKLMQVLHKYEAKHKLLLTGTPLQNNLTELWSILNFLEPQKFDNVKDFLSGYGILNTTEQVTKLHQLLAPHILRRTKEVVELALPPKEETLIELDLTTTQKKYYRAIYEKNRDFLKRYAPKVNMNNVMMQLRKVCNHPFLVEGVETALCDKKSKQEVSEILMNTSSKFIFMDKLLRRLQEAGSRVLIFSQMVKLLDVIEKYLQASKFQFERFDGSNTLEERQAAIDRFCNPKSDSFIFLLSTRAGGLGINLQIADTVIIFDSDWNPQNDLQAQARVHRIGQLKPVKVYRLITKNTYEKYMFQIASKKLGLGLVVLGKSADEDILKRLQRDEVEKLLRYGAYDFFAHEKESSNFDFDSIMKKATTIKFNKDQGANEFKLNFSKATFHFEGDQEIDIHADDFWDQILGFKSTTKLTKSLYNNTDLQTEDQKTQFMNDMQGLMDEWAQNPLDMQRGREVEQLLSACSISNRLDNKRKEKIQDWINEIQAPRLRKRKEEKKYSLSKRDNKYAESEGDEDFEPDDDEEEEEFVTMDKEDDEILFERVKKPQFSAELTAQMTAKAIGLNRSSSKLPPEIVSQNQAPIDTQAFYQDYLKNMSPSPQVIPKHHPSSANYNNFRTTQVDPSMIASFLATRTNPPQKPTTSTNTSSSTTSSTSIYSPPASLNVSAAVANLIRHMQK